jgi:hypothetical protein
MASARLAPKTSWIDFCERKAMANEAVNLPRQDEPVRNVDTFQLTDFHPSEDVSQGHVKDLCGSVLRFEEEPAGVRGGVGHGVIVRGAVAACVGRELPRAALS